MLTNDDIPAFSAVVSETPKTETGITAPQPAAAAAANAPAAAPTGDRAAKPLPAKVPEIGGPTGPEPTRYGDWERKGICVDF